MIVLQESIPDAARTFPKDNLGASLGLGVCKKGSPIGGPYVDDSRHLGARKVGRHLGTIGAGNRFWSDCAEGLGR